MFCGRTTELLRYHGNNEHFYTVDSYIFANNNKREVLLRFNGNNGQANKPQCNVVLHWYTFVTQTSATDDKEVTYGWG